MTWAHHRQMRARDFLSDLGLAPGGGNDPEDPNNGSNDPNGGNSASSPSQPASNTSKSEASKTEDAQKSTSTTTTTTQEEAKDTSKSSAAESSQTSQSSSASSVIPASNTVSKPPVVTNNGNSNKALGGSLTFEHTTASDTGLPTDGPSIGGASHVSIGAVAGGVAAGIAGIALIIFAIVFIMRRKRASSGSEEFDPVSFRRSASMVEDVPSDPFNPRPPTMIERHNAGPSMAGGGMAGAGAYSNHAHDYYAQDQYAQDQYAQDQYAQDQYAAAAAAHQPIQQRQQYTYGETYDDADHNGSDVGHGAEYNGAYSSDPQQQNIYAAEAYAYPEDDQVVVTPGMQAEDMGRHHQQQFHANDTNDAYGGM